MDAERLKKHLLMPDDQAEIRRSAADYIRIRGPNAIHWLMEQAELAQAQGDVEAAKTWREVASTAAWILKSHLDPMT